MNVRSRRLPLAALRLATTLILAGCSADPLNVVLLNARFAGDKCDFADATLFTEGGSLDFRPWQDAAGNTGQSVSYHQDFSWENQMTPLPITVNGQVVDPGGGSDFIADSVVYSYQYTDPNVVLSPETSNIRAVISAGGAPDKNFMGVELIQAQASAALNASLTPAAQTLLVTFQVFGKTGAGVSKYTNKVSFPLTVYKSATTTLVCPNGSVLYAGPCNEPGRDSPVRCIKSG